MSLGGNLGRAIRVLAYAAGCFLLLINSNAAPADSELSKLLQNGENKRKRGEYSAAIIDFNRALEMDTNCAECYSKRGWAKLQSNDPDGAAADATQSIRLDSKDALSYFVRSLARWDRDKLDGALADMNQAIELRPEADTFYELRGNIEDLKGDSSAALKDYDRAIEKAGKPRAYRLRASLKANQGDFEGGLADCAIAIQKDAANGAAYSLRAHIKAAANDLAGSISDFDLAAKLETNNASVFACRGLTKQRTGDLKGAFEDFRLAVNANPTNHDYGSINLWLAQCRRGEKSKADEQLSQYVAARGKNEGAEWPLPLMRFLLGRMNENELEQAACSPVPKRERKQQAECHYYIGMKKLIEGNKTEALAAFRKCVETGRATLCEYGIAKSQVETLEK
jgi:tetratricopeptide (TPR) repeat protein